MRPPSGAGGNSRLDFLDGRISTRLRRLLRPPPRGLLRRRGPVSQQWGFDRGLPIDRHFVEGFLRDHSSDIRGAVLEVKDDGYTRRFGTGVDRADVLDIDPDNPAATVVADLSHAPQIPDNTYDCVLLTQVLHLIYDMPAAVRESRRILRPGGVLLATMPAVSRCSRASLESDFWRLTPAAARRLFGESFGQAHVGVTGVGNAVLGAAFLMGVATEELSGRVLRDHDPLFPMLVCIRGVKEP